MKHATTLMMMTRELPNTFFIENTASLLTKRLSWNHSNRYDSLPFDNGTIIEACAVPKFLANII